MRQAEIGLLLHWSRSYRMFATRMGATMFAPKIAKPQTKATEDSMDSRAPQRPSLTGQCHGPVEPALMLQQMIGNQATRLLLQRNGNPTGNVRHGDNEQETDPLSPTAPEATPGVSWNFSRNSASWTYEEEANRVAAHVFSGRSFLQEKARVDTAPERAAPRDEPVPAALRQVAEPLLGRDFSSVRLRGVSSSEEAAAPAGTLAVTSGNTISFFPGRYQPDLPLGQALIAHELTHVAQQRAAPPLPSRGQGLRASFAREIANFRAEYPSERLAGAHDALADTSGLYPISMAPSGMQQRCTGCDSCKQGGDKTPSSPSASTATPTPATPVTSSGTTARAAAKALIDERQVVKEARDKLKVSLDEIRKGRSLEFHKSKTPEVIKRGAKAVGIAEAGLLSDWDWFLQNGPPSAKPRADEKTWESHQEAFLRQIQSPLDKLERGHEKSQASYLLKNTPSNVFDLIIQASTPMVPPALLYAIAGTEGLVDRYIRPQVASPATSPDKLSEAELAGVSVTKPIHGFQELGLDDFFSELEQKRKPLSGFFPPGFDQTKVTESPNTNEFGRRVRSADAPDLKTGLQALVTVISRRQALFQDDRKSLGYVDPTGDERVYFTYVYYNSGPGDPALGDGTSKDNGGFQTLSRHRPAHPTVAQRRKLGDWIRLREYPNAIKVLQTYQVIVASAVLKGY
jgi:hypothetical protein